MVNWKSITLDEKLNAITHCLGLVIALIGAPFIIIESLGKNSIPITIAIAVFCVSMIWMYFSSTFYHISISDSIKKLWHKIDHISIFALIGGTYTPFIAIYYSDRGGWSFLSFLWLLILFGIVFKIFKFGKHRIISTLLYVLLGWMVVVIYKPITEHMSDQVHYWLITGGILYTSGVFFYLWRKIRFHHAVWHLFVLGGTVAHFISLFLSL